MSHSFVSFIISRMMENSSASIGSPYETSLNVRQRRFRKHMNCPLEQEEEEENDDDESVKEQTMFLKNIIKDKEKDERTVSKEGYSTIRAEVLKTIQDTQHNIKMFCKENTNCKNNLYLQGMKKIKNLKRECEKSKYHKKRCIRYCDAAFMFLHKKIKKYQHTPK